jgi:hypothetical protein
VQTSANGVITTDSAHVYRGTQALHFQLYNSAGSNSPYINLELQKRMWSGFSPAPNPTYVRFFLYMPVKVPNIYGTFSPFTDQQNGPGSYYGILSIDLDMNSLIPNIGASNWTPNVARVSGSSALPLNQWTCLEFQVEVNVSGSDPTFLKLLINDSLAITGNAVDGVVASSLGVGFGGGALPPNTPTTDFWIDEVAIDTNPIGCSK